MSNVEKISSPMINEIRVIVIGRRDLLSISMWNKMELLYGYAFEILTFMFFLVEINDKVHEIKVPKEPKTARMKVILSFVNKVFIVIPPPFLFFLEIISQTGIQVKLTEKRRNVKLSEDKKVRTA